MSKFFKNVFAIVLVQIVVYLLMFVGFSYFVHSNIENFLMAIVWIVVIAIYFGLIARFKCNWIELLIGIIPIWLLTYLYHPNNLYGISDGQTGLDVFSAGVDAFLFALSLYILQIIIKLVIRLSKKVARKNK